MRVEVEWGFWVVLGLAALLVPMRFLAGILLAAVIHEGGHLFTIRFTGGEICRIRVRAVGAVIETPPMTPGREILCALAGPAAGALTVLVWRWFPELALAGLVQTGFNLLPIYPLDGGRVVRNICCKFRDFRVQ